MRREEKERILKLLNDVQSVFAKRVAEQWEQTNLEAFWDALAALTALAEAESRLARPSRTHA